MKYKLYQVKRNLTRDCGFMSLSMLKDLNIEIDLNNYDMVYQGEIESDGSTLDKLFTMFNVNHPEDFIGRSMSVSDIVEIDNNYYYCDSFSWQKIYFIDNFTKNILSVKQKNEQEIEQLINYIKSEYPKYNYLNENTNISNIHLYKLVKALEACIIK